MAVMEFIPISRRQW